MRGDYQSIWANGWWTRPAVDIRGSVSNITPDVGDTLTVTGNVQASDGCNVTLNVKVRKKSDDSLVDALFSNTVDLSTGANDLPTLCGGSIEWDTTGEDPIAYYVEVAVTDGATDILEDAKDRLFFKVVTGATGYVDTDIVLSDPAPKVGDTVSVTGNIQSSMNMTVTASVAVYKKTGDVLMSTLFSGSVDLTAGANDIVALCGALEWDTTPHAGEAYYVKIHITGADLVFPESDRLHFVSLPAGGKYFGRYKTV